MTLVTAHFRGVDKTAIVNSLTRAVNVLRRLENEFDPGEKIFEHRESYMGGYPIGRIAKAATDAELRQALTETGTLKILSHFEDIFAHQAAVGLLRNNNADYRIYAGLQAWSAFESFAEKSPALEAECRTHLLTAQLSQWRHLASDDQWSQLHDWLTRPARAEKEAARRADEIIEECVTLWDARLPDALHAFVGAEPAVAAELTDALEANGPLKSLQTMLEETPRAIGEYALMIRLPDPSTGDVAAWEGLSLPLISALKSFVDRDEAHCDGTIIPQDTDVVVVDFFATYAAAQSVATALRPPKYWVMGNDGRVDPPPPRPWMGRFDL